MTPRSEFQNRSDPEARLAGLVGSMCCASFSAAAPNRELNMTADANADLGMHHER